MGRGVGTVLGIAVVAIAAIWVAKSMLKPTQEKVERRAPVLSGEYAPRLEECRALPDTELPAGVPAPLVDEDLLYVEVIVLFPGVSVVQDVKDHRLAEINGVVKTSLSPVFSSVDVAEEGAYLVLVFKANHAFENARLVCNGQVVLERVELQ
jgi:hypothetical protein